MLRSFLVLATAASLAGCSLFLDAGETDSGPGLDPCSEDSDASLIAHWRFEDPLTSPDELGGPAATASGLVVPVTGPTGCGGAIEIGALNPGHVVIDYSEQWAQIKAFDFFVRTPAEVTEAGVISFDSDGPGRGHLSLWIAEPTTAGSTRPVQIAVRLQDGVGDEFVCSSIRERQEWSHIGINVGLGGLEIWVDGVEPDRTGEVSIPSLSGERIDCALAETEVDLTENINPWVLGASSGQSMAGQTDRIERHFVGGAIDNLRFFSERRDFAR